MTNDGGTTIAGPEVGQPGSIDEVDAAWMTSVLRTSGALDEATSVASVDVEPFALGAGLLSLLYQATMRYDGGTGPQTVIVKVPTTDPHQRGTADQLAFYQREIFYYREIGPTSGLRGPKIHAAMMAEDSTDFVLVMEDLSGYATYDQRTGMPWDAALRSAEAIGTFHARWQGAEQLETLQKIFLPVNFPGYYEALPQIFAAGWGAAQQHAADVLDPEIVAFGDRWGSLVPFFLGEMCQDATLIHGDWRADNLFFDGDEVVAIDHQIMGTGAGEYDLGYFVSQSVAPDVRAGREQEIVDRYVAARAAAGPTPDPDVVDRRFRIAVAHCFIYGVTSFQAWDALPDRSREVLLTMIERSARAVLDLDSLSLLPTG